MTVNKKLTMFARIHDRIATADKPVSKIVLISEIDEALFHAWQTKQSLELNTSQRDIIETFINNLLDCRLELM
jgi:hypothetical protein